MTAAPKTETLEALESQLVELMKVKVFNDDVRIGAQWILDAIPPPEDEKDTNRKVRLLLLRCKAKLLMPYVSKDAEKDLNMVLKLKQGSAQTWVELSECFLRRNAFKEAGDALDNALRAEPQNTVALCKYSQVLRNRCGEAGATAEQKSAFLADSVAKAHEAVRVDMEDADAWNTLSLSLLSAATAEGMTYKGARKALAAMQQAARRVTGDPDVHFNKAVLESLTGEFGAAVTDFAQAHALDSTRLKGTRHLCEENVSVLRRAAQRMKNATGIGRRDFKLAQTHLANAVAKAKRDGAPSAAYLHTAVVDIVSDTKMQPQTLLTVDEQGAFAFVLMYGVNGGVFKIGDVVSFPPATTPRVEVAHSVAAVSALGVEELSLTIPHYYTDANAMLVNLRSVPANGRVPLQLSTRLFA